MRKGRRIETLACLPLDMPSNWKLFSDAGNNFRWETSHQLLHGCPLKEQDTNATRLPSMADLLLLGRSQLVDNWRCTYEEPPMFLTGSGKPVLVQQSSVAKASSILGDADASVNEKGITEVTENSCPLSKPKFAINFQESVETSEMQNAPDDIVTRSNSLFRTVSGKAFHPTPASLIRAKALLAAVDDVKGDGICRFEGNEKESISRNVMASEASFHRYLGTSSLLSDKEKLENVMPTAIEPLPIKFQTAGGKSVSVSTDALQRARNLLGDLDVDSFLNEACTANPSFLFADHGKATCGSTPTDKGKLNVHSSQKKFTSPLRSHPNWSFSKSEKVLHANNLIPKFDEVADTDHSTRFIHVIDQEAADLCVKKVDYMSNGFPAKNDPLRRSCCQTLLDNADTRNVNANSVGRKRLQGTSSVPPFKRPRSAFVTALNEKSLSAPNVFLRTDPTDFRKHGSCIQYPFQCMRTCIKDYFLQPPLHKEMLESIPEDVKSMNPESAECYVLRTSINAEGFGPEAFYNMMSDAGASMESLTHEWLSNHYKWIIWKLASYERSYPSKFLGKLMTVANVLEELRYRYEREVHHGHRSAIKKILDGDALPSSLMVLCISSIRKKSSSMHKNQNSFQENSNGRDLMIELTDGWYSMKAQLDVQLHQKLASGKLFIGQKLRIWGAKLCGWVGPVSPLEASQTTSLLLHINGTYRCHWAEKLGFCKRACMPLNFRCIKPAGGAIPNTFVGIKRIYPILYRERLSNGNFIVRSEKTETKARQMYNERRDAVAEGVISAFQKEAEYDLHDNQCEGAKLMKLLETAAEPEVLMAGLSSKQLTSFSSYRAKLEALRQSEMQKSIEKALEASGLAEREVTPFFRIKVVGILSSTTESRHPIQEGMITIWNPTEKQMLELCEGQACSVSGLVASSLESDFLHLQARGSTSSWLPLPPSIMDNLVPFFTCRESVKVSSLNNVVLSSEFDVAALVVHVTEVYKFGHYNKQWVFVTDGTTSDLSSKCPDAGLLAINFSTHENETSPSVNYNIVGSVVGFCNLVKRPTDQVNGIWVAEATENSDYLLSYHDTKWNHLKNAAASVSAWANRNTSGLVIEKLKEYILSII